MDSQKLLRKLFHYGFSNSAINLIANYFNCRSQTVKYNNKQSAPLTTKLGVPQGSVLGPLFFLIYINDLAYLLKLNCKMFADDTTLYDSSTDIAQLITQFVEKLKPFVEWCKFNKLDINWSKTFFMIITDKRIKKRPSEIKVLDVAVKIVDHFKLLGVTIDNKLSFSKFSSELKSSINKKLFSIKRLFYLSTSVKMQFFKSFILPYFDYCLSLLIYFPKPIIQSLNNCFNSCLFKLFNFTQDTTIEEDSNNDNLNSFNNKLQSYGLFSYQHRLMNKLFTFLNNISLNTTAPAELKTTLINAKKTADETQTQSTTQSTTQSATQNTTKLRNGKTYDKSIIITSKHTLNTFQYVATKIFKNFPHINFQQDKATFISNTLTYNYLNIRIFLKAFLKFNTTYSNISTTKKNGKKNMPNKA